MAMEITGKRILLCFWTCRGYRFNKYTINYNGFDNSLTKHSHDGKQNAPGSGGEEVEMKLVLLCMVHFIFLTFFSKTQAKTHFRAVYIYAGDFPTASGNFPE